ncbi:MAG TPA: hypothetical protein VI524_14175 [Anaerolineales bacterium]|jgi:hypothetical protein|nr:hypothetical protein [Anaerolineales bacterium]
MKHTLKWTVLILLAAAVGLALAVLVAVDTWAQLPTAVAPRTAVQATPFPYNGQWGFGPGMMGGWSSGSPDNGPIGIYTPTQTLPYSSDGPGMMRGWGTGWRAGRGPGMMGDYMGGMMGWGYATGARSYSSSTPLTLDQAVDAARQYLSAYGNPDLVLTEVMEFSENFYAEVEEESTGVHAFELLIDRFTGAVYPEPGPNMIWNTKYGHMGGMMGGRWDQAPDTISVTSEQARDLAQKWLDQYLPGTSAAEQADAFYGYYTIHVLKDGQVFGMLSVNGYTGEVWFHDWHGNFIEMKELEE